LLACLTLSSPALPEEALGRQQPCTRPPIRHKRRSLRSTAALECCTLRLGTRRGASRTKHVDQTRIWAFPGPTERDPPRSSRN